MQFAASSSQACDESIVCDGQLKICTVINLHIRSACYNFSLNLISYEDRHFYNVNIYIILYIYIYIYIYIYRVSQEECARLRESVP